MATDYSSNEFRRAGWLVYINGLEIPVESVSTSGGVWQPPSATLNVLPHSLLRRIGAEDRIQVAIFYLDHHWNPHSPTFRLLGEYEIVGWGYNNTPRGRFIQLQCLGQMTFFQQLQFFYLSAVDDMVLALSAAGRTNTAVAYQTKVLYPMSLFYEGLVTTAGEGKPGEPIKRPIEFVLNVFKAILAAPESATGTDAADPKVTKVPDAAVTVPGKNFFARWLLMTQFHRRWAGFPGVDDPQENGGAFPLLKAAQGVQMLDVLKNRVGESVGNSGTAWDLLQLVLGYMYMEPVSILAPPAFEVDPDTALATSGAAHPVTANTRIASHYVKPAMYFALPPTCNVIFPSQITSWQYAEEYRSVPTRLYMNELFLTKYLNEGTPEQASAAISSKDLMVTGYPPPVLARMRAVLKSTADNSKNMLLFPEEFYIGPNAAQCSSPPWLFMLAQEIQASPSAQVTENDPLSAYHEIFDNFAQYEYYRRRYADRGGSVSMAWNPYLIPGLPGVIFDKPGSGMDIFMYISNVSHSLDAKGNMSTTASFSFARTLEEFAGVAGATTLQSMAETATSSRGSVAKVVPKWTDVGTAANNNTAYKAPTGGGNGSCVLTQDSGVLNKQKPHTFNFPGEDVSQWTAADKEAWNKVCYFYDVTQGDGVTEMHPALVPVIAHIARGFPGKKITIVKGYEKNSNHGAVEFHKAGKALDLRVEGVPREQLFLYLADSYKTGLNLIIYPGSSLAAVHTEIRKNTSDPTLLHVNAARDPHDKNGYLQGADKAAWIKAARAGKAPGVNPGNMPQYRQTTTVETTDDGPSIETPSSPAELAGMAAGGQSWPVYTPDPIYDMYPGEPIPEIAQAYQSLKNAQENYSRLLYGSNSTGRAAVFEWKTLLEAQDSDENRFSLVDSLARLTNNCALVPKAELAPMYENYDAAMGYNARPVCSLQDYISIWHKKGNAAEEKASLAQVQGANTAFYGAGADGDGSQGAVYPTRIYKLRQGPGEDPGAEVTNITPSETYAPVDKFRYAPKDMPQTRDNWDARLEEYRKILLSEPGYRHPQG